MNTYIIEGGIGKQVAFTAIIDALVKKDKEKIQIHSPYVDIFGGNLNVKFALDANTIPVHDKRILDSQNIFFCEPYKANFIKGEQHIIQSYCKLFGVKYDEKMRPKMFTDHYKEDAKRVAGTEKDFIVVQFTGGQAPAGYNPQNNYLGGGDPSRNYDSFLAQKVIDLIKEKHEDLKIINFSLPNEPAYEKTERPELIPFAQWHEILKMSNCKGFISVDSCLNHFARSAGRKGVVIWGGTRWTQFGYKQNRNINYWFRDSEWNEEKFEPQDPRNIMVEPEFVFEQFGKIHGKELIK